MFVWVREENHSPVVAKCAVELPARHQVIIPMPLKEIGVDLADSKLNSTQAKQLEKLVLSYSDIFPRVKVT